MLKPKNRPSKTTDLFSSAEFMELQAEWYEKARASGFTDIEDGDGFIDADAEKQAKKTLLNCPDRAEALANYYTEAERALGSLVFESAQDRAIWVHHARGATEHEVARLVGVTRQAVQRRLAKYRKRVGIKRPR